MKFFLGMRRKGGSLGLHHAWSDSEALWRIVALKIWDVRATCLLGGIIIIRQQDILKKGLIELLHVMNGEASFLLCVLLMVIHEIQIIGQ
jgi:hypothetical protein